eukprot:CAMPEP_0172190710 /NCGR_PEP_ID=MMETSP1050-20130122/23271_1 /TAXON_ID=233186 /ORGANISM="Cryptomonas curvata, Strain CCAP979/52" /LENGTH=1079 /DNA_ID=CAMNT_0012865627 /DNA_START=270 /DNA_END=3505 /DNA_ORIENTATION=+
MVTIIGVNFCSDIQIRFGAKFPLSTSFVSNSELLAVAPANGQGSVMISCSCNSEDFRSTIIEYIYNAPWIIHQLEPSEGNTLESTVVLVHGDYFANFVDIMCAFGQSKVWISSILIRCVLPAAFPGNVSAFIAVGGARVTSNEVTFAYKETKRIRNFHPSTIRSAGGSLVTLSLTGFNQVPRKCLFGQIEAIPTVLSSTSIVCRAPSNSPGLVNLSVISGDEIIVADHRIMYNESALVYDVEPKIGSTKGGTSISVSGIFFSKDIEYKCVFGYQDDASDEALLSSSSSAFFVSINQLVCISPAHKMGTTLFRLIQQDFVVMKDVIYFAFIDVHVTFIYPSSGPVSGFSRVRITGQNFRRTKSLLCKFGDIVVPGEWKSYDFIICSSPAGMIGSVKLHVTVNGLDYSEGNISFLFEPEIKIFGISPSIGPTSGNTKVLVSGQNFNPSKVWCKFGVDIVEAFRYHSSTAILCISHPASSGNVSVEVSGNRNEFTKSGTLFEYLLPENALTTEVQKKIIYRCTLSINGTSFNVTSSEERDRLIEYLATDSGLAASQILITNVTTDLSSGATLVTFEFWSIVYPNATAQRLCGIPSNISLPVQRRRSLLAFEEEVEAVGFSNAVAGIDTVHTNESVVQSAINYDLAKFLVDFFSEATVYGISPQSGPVKGGTMISVSGERFVMGMTCKFWADDQGNSEITEAIFYSESLVLCKAPRKGNSRSVHISVFLNDVNESLFKTVFYYYDEPVLYSVELERSMIRVRGEGFRASSMLRCKIGDAEVAATLHEAQLLVCTAPTEYNQLRVEVSNNGQDYTSSGFSLSSSSMSINQRDAVPDCRLGFGSIVDGMAGSGSWVQISTHSKLDTSNIGFRMLIYSGPGAGQVVTVLGYDVTRRVAKVSELSAVPGCINSSKPQNVMETGDFANVNSTCSLYLILEERKCLEYAGFLVHVESDSSARYLGNMGAFVSYSKSDGCLTSAFELHVKPPFNIAPGDIFTLRIELNVGNESISASEIFEVEPIYADPESITCILQTSDVWIDSLDVVSICRTYGRESRFSLGSIVLSVRTLEMEKRGVCSIDSSTGFG